MDRQPLCEVLSIRTRSQTNHKLIMTLNRKQINMYFVLVHSSTLTRREETSQNETKINYNNSMKESFNFNLKLRISAMTLLLCAYNAVNATLSLPFNTLKK